MKRLRRDTNAEIISVKERGGEMITTDLYCNFCGKKIESTNGQCYCEGFQKSLVAFPSSHTGTRIFKHEENLKMGENNVYKAVEKYLDECLLDEMSQNMAKSDQEYHLKINVYMLKRVVQIMLTEMAKDAEYKEEN